MAKRVDREDKSLLIGKRNKDVFSLELMTWVPSFKDLATWPTESSLCTGALQGYMLLTTQSFPFKVVETEKFINDKFPTPGRPLVKKFPTVGTHVAESSSRQDSSGFLALVPQEKVLFGGM